MSRKANSDLGAQGATRTANSRKAGGSTAMIATSATEASPSRPRLVDWSTTNRTTSASSSVAMALLFTQKLSSAVSQKDGNESRMKPVEGVRSASAIRTAGRRSRSNAATAPSIPRASMTTRRPRCWARTRVPVRSS